MYKSGCVFCNDYREPLFQNPLISIDVNKYLVCKHDKNGVININKRKINYCPICGRKLK